MKRRRAFTLIEMVVMIMIIAILSSVAVPAYHRFRARTQFEETVQKTVSLLAWARAAAIESNADTVVRYDHTTGAFMVTVEMQPPSEDAPAALQDAEHAPIPPQPRMETLGEDVAVAQFSVNQLQPGMTSQSGIQQMHFHDDGSADGARIALVSADGYRAFLQVLPMTGRTVVSDEPQ